MVNKEDKFAIIGMLFLITFMWSVYIIYRHFTLKNCYCTIAIYNGLKGSGAGIKNTVYFNAKKRKIEAEIPIDLDIKKGDTIWIKYSKFDPTVVEVIDLNYKKHIKNKKCE
ncbi:MAG: hypothetical protein FGM14_15725 [Flavobacteriales bacterium]|nr:hypothetical protein [Flavobacteriales bacterium]